MTLLSMDLSRLTWKVFGRHLEVYRRSWKVSVSLNFIEPLLYLLALGVGLGTLVVPIDGVPYLNFLAPGLIASSAMMAASFECTYGSFVRMDYQKTFYAMVATPVSMDDVTAGEMLYGAFKSFLYGTIILLVITALGLVTSPWALLIPVVAAVAGLLFAEMALIWTGLVPNIGAFDHYFSLIITPLFLFSGVFFPLSNLHPVVQQAAWLSPLYHVVNLTRALATGNVEPALLGDLIWLAIVTLALFPLPIYLMRRLVIK